MMYNVHKNQYLMWFIRFDNNKIRFDFRKDFLKKLGSPIFFQTRLFQNWQKIQRYQQCVSLCNINSSFRTLVYRS